MRLATCCESFKISLPEACYSYCWTQGYRQYGAWSSLVIFNNESIKFIMARPFKTLLSLFLFFSNIYKIYFTVENSWSFTRWTFYRYTYSRRKSKIHITTVKLHVPLTVPYYSFFPMLHTRLGLAYRLTTLLAEALHNKWAKV